MDIISLVVYLCLLGLVAYLVERFAPISAEFKQIIKIVLIIVAILVVLQAFGLIPLNLGAVPQVR